MNVDKDTLRKVAHLARLQLDTNQEDKLLEGFNNIIDWMSKLNELDTQEVKPLIHLSAELNILREDQVKDVLAHDKGLKNAPQKDSDYFRVPKVLE